MAILFSILTAVVYGASDFCGGLASRRTATLGVVVVSQGVGFAMLLAIVPLFGGAPARADLLWGAVCGCAGGGAIVLLYRGLSIGTMGVVSPTTAIVGASVPVIYGIVVRHDRPSLLAASGIVAALIAVVCVSAQAGDAGPGGDADRAFGVLPPGLLEAMVAGIFFGVFFIALAQTRGDAGMYPLLAARFTSLALLAGGGIAAGRAAQLRVSRPVFALVAVCGALDMAANVLYVLAAHSGGMLSIVAVISSLYPASTVALAGVILGERLSALQWTGVAIALAGVVAISIGH